MKKVETEDEKNIEEEKKLIKEELKRKKSENKRKKKVEKKLKDITTDKKEIFEIRRKRYIIEFVIISFFVVILLILLCNRTFFREEYRTKKIDIDIPLLTFFVKDDGNKLVLKTLRKSEYVRTFFDSYLEGFTMYNCEGNHFYYDDEKNFAIYDITVEKKFAIKTITIEYGNGSIDCLCSYNTDACK